MKKILVSFGIIALLIVASYMYFSYDSGDAERASVSSITGNAVLGSDSSNSEISSDSLPIKKDLSTLEFEGFSVAKSHIGGFDEWAGEVYFTDSELSGFSGTIKANSVNTGIERLDTHLQSDDFFDVSVYPEINFQSTSIYQENGKTYASGILSFRGIQNQITFPIELNQNSISSEFLLDITPFSFKYTGVNSEVRIKFNFIY